MVGSTLSVIVRFHNPQRLFELRRCIFSLVCQNYAPIEICLITQRFGESDIRSLRKSLADLLALNESVDLRISNFSEAQPVDARSALINLGVSKASGRYLAILDHDDTILPSGYPQLLEELKRSAVAIAFGSVAYKEIDVFQDALLVNRRLPSFVGRNLLDLFDHNFCPIHSFVLDRSRIDSGDLWLDAELNRHEDYEFLLRICAKYRSSFELIGTFVGDYYLKNDGSNANTWLSGEKGEWEDSLKAMERRKERIFLSPIVLAELGLPNVKAEFSIGDLLRSHVMMGQDDHS